MPRPIDHALDDIFYLREANLDNFGDKQAPLFGVDDEGIDENETEGDVNE